MANKLLVAVSQGWRLMNQPYGMATSGWAFIKIGLRCCLVSIRIMCVCWFTTKR